MKLVKIKTTAAVVAHLDPNKEYKAISHEGVLYLPAFQVGDDEDEDPAPKKAPVAKTKDVPKEEEASKPAAAGKPKVRGAAKPEPEKEELSSDLTKGVTDLCNQFDKTDISEAKFITELVALTGGDKTKIKDAVGEFASDADMKIKDAVVLILEAAGAGTPTAPAAKSKRGAAKTEEVEDEDGDLDAPVKHKTLEVGDKVNVFWASEDKWFKGEVSAVKRNGEVLIDYTDGTSEILEEDDVVNLID